MEISAPEAPQTPLKEASVPNLTEIFNSRLRELATLSTKVDQEINTATNIAEVQTAAISLGFGEISIHNLQLNSDVRLDIVAGIYFVSISDWRNLQDALRKQEGVVIEKLVTPKLASNFDLGQPQPPIKYKVHVGHSTFEITQNNNGDGHFSLVTDQSDNLDDIGSQIDTFNAAIMAATNKQDSHQEPVDTLVLRAYKKEVASNQKIHDIEVTAAFLLRPQINAFMQSELTRAQKLITNLPQDRRDLASNTYQVLLGNVVHDIVDSGLVTEFDNKTEDQLTALEKSIIGHAKKARISSSSGLTQWKRTHDNDTSSYSDPTIGLYAAVITDAERYNWGAEENRIFLHYKPDYALLWTYTFGDTGDTDGRHSDHVTKKYTWSEAKLVQGLLEEKEKRRGITRPVIPVDTSNTHGTYIEGSLMIQKDKFSQLIGSGDLQEVIIRDADYTANQALIEEMYTNRGITVHKFSDFLH